MDDPNLKPLITTYDDWRIPFIGRTINESFRKKFSITRYKDRRGREQLKADFVIDSTFEQEND